MWGHMVGQGTGVGYGCGRELIRLGIVVWSVIFTVLVLKKLDKIIRLLEKK
jgi:hypothetical protein